MRYTLKYICLLLLCIVVDSCHNLEDIQTEQEVTTEYGSIEVGFTGNTRATTTVISPEEAKNFLITVTQGDNIVRGPQTLGTMNMRFPVGQGYKVYAESCSEADAESENNFWGKKRFTGESIEFGINKGETTKASVGMSVCNAAICVVIDKSMINYFKLSCSVSVSEGDRNLEWTYANAGTSIDGNVSEGQIAYFNIDETASRTIHYSIKASAQGNITDVEGTLTLTRTKMSRLLLRKESGSYALSISVSQEDLFVNANETFTPDDVITDDGATDIVGGNEDFGSNDSGVDYDQYN